MPQDLKDLEVSEISLVKNTALPANQGAKVVLVKVDKPGKTEDGETFPVSDYAYVPDPESPSTWKLRLTRTPGGKPDAGIVGAAAAALGSGFRGNKVSIPVADRDKVKAKVRSAWKEANPDKQEDEMPQVLQKTEGVDMEKPKWLEKLLSVLKVDQSVVQEILKEEDVDPIEKLTKEVEALTKRADFSDAVSKVSVAISKAADEASLKAAENELTKLSFAEGDTRGQIMKEAIADKRSKLSKAGGSAQHKIDAEKFKKEKLPAAMHGAFDSMDEDAQKAFMGQHQGGEPDGDEGMAKAMKAVTKKVEDQASVIEKLQEEKALGELTKELSGKPISKVMNVEEIAKALLTLRKTNKAEADLLLSKMDAMAEQYKTSALFAVLGKGGEPTSSEQKIDQLTKSLMASDSSLTKEKAYTKVLEQNPQLYEMMKAEQEAAKK